ncbi:MAG: FAD-binding oxidoreductase [Algoriphagus sp.]|nr:FAD-binding oxidoreductase [Algoriphagus sp.]
MAYTLKIQQILPLTHDVKQIKVEKPEGYSFISGQATDVSINKKEWKDEKRPFSFTSLPEDKQLEFVIKSYRDHPGVTNQIDKLAVGDELIIDDAWGAIQYKGKGVFIAGGAGVTPFIGIIKFLQSKGELAGNRLFFANKTAKDVILESYFRDLLGSDFISILAKEEVSGHEFGMIDKAFLKNHIQDFSQKFYVCGPDPMVKAISASLKELGANPEEIVFEK